MKKMFVSMIALAMAFVFFVPVSKADTFTYAFTTQNSAAFGGGALTVTGTQIAPGEYQIGSGSITLFSNSAPGSPTGASGTLIPVSANSGSANSYFPGAVLSPTGSFYYDDLLYSTSNPLLDGAGLLFQIGGTEFNIYSNGNPTSGGLGYSIYDNNGLTAAGNFNVLSSPPPVPEPSSLMLLGTGLVGIGGLIRRKLAIG